MIDNAHSDEYMLSDRKSREVSWNTEPDTPHMMVTLQWIAEMGFGYFVDAYNDGLVEERPNSIASAMEWPLSCTNTSTLCWQ